MKSETPTEARVYRVQDRHGRGPFKPKFSHKWADEYFAPGLDSLPTWLEEFGADLIDRHGKEGEFFGSAVRDIRQILRWFSNTEQIKLQRLGYRVVAMVADRILAESTNQLVFARRKPLWRGALIVRWPEKAKAPVSSEAPEALDSKQRGDTL